jgi:hypothetical protein
MNYSFLSPNLIYLKAIHHNFQIYIIIHESYSEINLRLFQATNVGVGESSRIWDNVTWLIAL